MCSRSRKLVVILLVSKCYCFVATGVVSVVCSIFLSKGIEPFKGDLTRAPTRPETIKLTNLLRCSTIAQF